jgi:thioredoxin-like negative regulator of GroEL
MGALRAPRRREEARPMEAWSPETLQARLETGGPVFLKLWKKGCGACKLSEPALERIVAADTQGIHFGQISVDDHPEMLEIAETDVLPAFFVFHERDMKGKFIGFKGLAKLQEFIAQSLAKASPETTST